MTSFDFVVSCGGCHPGGGPLEFDRDGQRYDRRMADPSSGFTPAGENDFDGDYYRARWGETGVLEADCLLCHLADYAMAERRRQIAALNFRWAATAGSGLARVTGSVKSGQAVQVQYDSGPFLPDGTVDLPMITQPRNETCLHCHAKPGWKKRGANFSPRTDVHLRAGMRCVDCHPGGSSAEDPRIHGREEHQIGKGDDPGNHVRDDLDNTCRACADCHTDGSFGAPIMKHVGLPPLHLERMACQACHIPERMVQTARFVASDVFNPGPRVPTKGKHLWTFYGADMAYWNHYGDLEMMGYADKPTDRFRPELARYNGLIRPVNRIHSAWPAIEVDGLAGLAQPTMSQAYRMWAAYRKDPSSYPELDEISDDDADGVIEVNRTEEIDALIGAVTRALHADGFPMDGKRVVWVMNNRVYRSGSDYRVLEKESWEASPYGNVHTYNHDVYPAQAALGTGGCTDCHHPDADFFFASIPRFPFDVGGDAGPQMQTELFGIGPAEAAVGAWRETHAKSAVYILFLGTCLILAGFVGAVLLRRLFAPDGLPRWFQWSPLLLAAGVGALLASSLWKPDLANYLLPSRESLDAHHFGIGLVVMILGALAWLLELRRIRARGGRNGYRRWQGLRSLSLLLMLLMLSGVLMYASSLLGIGARLAYTAFDVALALVLIRSAAAFLREMREHVNAVTLQGATVTRDGVR